MDPDQLADHLFEDRTNIDEVFALPEGVDPIDAAMRMYAQMSAAARLLWNPRHDRALPRLLRRITAPTLLVGAENDRLLPDENTVGSYAQLIPHARTTRIPGTGHALVVEQPEAVAQTVLDFVKEQS
jgi:pimeloyl-ACP methyl ester carboxylesterase